MKTTRLIIVGGFLGAGKTTLLWETASRFMKDDKRVGLITNDQAPELVDTALLSHNNVKVTEVSGSCFCCNFDGLISALRQVRSDAQADVIIAEPVGSCTDLSATIIQPLKEHMKAELEVSPFTVLADPARLADILDGGNADLHPSAAYIYKKQLEEADIILITKTDLLQAEELIRLIKKTELQFPGPQILPVSSKTGEGLAAWIKIISESNQAGQRLIEVDYDVYAEGEAVLGWLNSTLELEGVQTDWDKFAKDFLTNLSQKIDQMGVGVGHVKIMLETGDTYLVGNLTGKASTLNFRGKAGVADNAKIIINARVGVSSETLDRLVHDALDAVKDNTVVMKPTAWKCLSPGYPNPTYRYKKVV